MAKLESYSNLSKSYDDLEKKNFCFSNILGLSLYARTPGFNFKSSFKQASNLATSGLTYFQYKGSALTVKQEFGSNSLSKTTVEYIPESYSQLKAKLEIESRGKENMLKQALSGEYTHSKCKSKIAINEDLYIKGSSVFGVSQFGGGLDFAYDVKTSSLVGYNAAIWLFRQDFKAVLKHISVDKKKFRLGNLVASAYYSKNKDLEAGASITFTDKNVTGQVILQSTLSEGKLVKARANNIGEIAVALRSKISPNVTVVTAAQFAALDRNQPMKFGLRLKFNQ